MNDSAPVALLMVRHIRALAAGTCAVLLLCACGEPARVTQPKEIAAGTACALDGMLLEDFPGPKAQIQYERDAPEFFCDLKEMFMIYLQEEQKRRIVALYTQDMGQADWMQPKGHWIDAKTAFYVVGSKKQGSMGPAIASFASEQAAQRFAGKEGGQVLRFDQVTPEMVDLSGGVVHDRRM
ncbi:MAG: nitrous oxide reductase accessory protein NosL [Betaproteobacteria bacterium HGW-Betaproteobacteria-11]|nr:MAG: nitrous oxide reductase accessory protein NosL [Betaproteobacteria bacterium HGW-Betaproteobacteria-11]